MENIKWLGLQLFADGGDGATSGGDAGASTAETGVNTPDAGEERLRALGVPEDGIKRWSKRNRGMPAAKNETESKAGSDPAAVSAAEPAPANNETPEDAEEAKTKYNWDEIKKNPEISRQMSEVVRARVKAEQDRTKAAQDKLDALRPALEDLSVAFGLDPKNLDIDAIVKAAGEKGQMFYDSKAYELGTTNEAARKIVKSEIEQQRAEAEKKNAEEMAAFNTHMASLREQGEKLKERYPAFDLRKEMEDPKFRELTRPGAFSVDDAYEFLHRKEIASAQMAAVTQAQAQKIANSIRSGQQRPMENGTAAQAPAVTTFDYSKASAEQKRAFKAYLDSERRAGRKVYPGQYRP